MTESLPQPDPAQAELLSRLTDLRDVALPTPVSGWPPAPGWWALAGLLLLALWLVFRFFRNRRSRRLYRREALEALHQARAKWDVDRDGLAYAIASDQLIRRVAIHLLGRDAVARLTGKAFSELANSLSSKALSSSTATLLTETRYRADPDFDVDPVHREVEDWIGALMEPDRA